MKPDPWITAERVLEWQPRPEGIEDRIREMLPKPQHIRDILRRKDIPAEYRVWMAMQPDVLSLRVQHLFSLRCARLALSCVASPDPRNVRAVEVAEMHVRGEATEAEMRDAGAEASDRDARLEWDLAWKLWGATTMTESAREAQEVAALIELIDGGTAAQGET